MLEQELETRHRAELAQLVEGESLEEDSSAAKEDHSDIQEEESESRGSGVAEEAAGAVTGKKSRAQKRKVCVHWKSFWE